VKPKQILVDGTDANTANLVRYARRPPMPVENLRSGSNPTTVSIQSRLWYNPGLETLYIGPGAMAIALTLFPTPSLVWQRSKSVNKVQSSRLASSLTGTEYLLGKQRRPTGWWAYEVPRTWWPGLALVFGLHDPPKRSVQCSTSPVAFLGIFIGSNTKSQYS